MCTGIPDCRLYDCTIDNDNNNDNNNNNDNDNNHNNKDNKKEAECNDNNDNKNRKDNIFLPNYKVLCIHIACTFRSSNRTPYIWRS